MDKFRSCTWLPVLLLLLCSSFTLGAQQPVLNSAITTGPGHYDVQISGSQFINSYVDTRPFGQHGMPTSYNAVAGVSGGFQTLTIRITDPAQRELLTGEGLDLWVVNQTNPPTWNEIPLRVQRDPNRSIPKIGSVTTAGVDGYTIVVKGTDFFEAQIDTRPWGQNVAPTRYQAIPGTDGLLQTLTFTVTDAQQRNFLNGDGLGVWVVNHTTPTAWNLYPERVRRTNTNLPPQVQLTGSYQSSNAPANITLAAAASDPDGSVVRVRFLRNGALLGDDTVPPYNWNDTQLPAGSYSYQAVAHDNAGATASSNVVSIVVHPAANNTPVILDAVSMGHDGYTIKVRGNNFLNPYIDTRPWGQNVSPTSYNPTLGTDGSYQTLTFYVSNSQQRQYLAQEGLAIWVVNRTSPSYAWNATPVRVQRSIPSAGPKRGGSNFLWYHVEPEAQQCHRESYAIIPSYHRPMVGALAGQGMVRDYVRSQLAQMYANGQRRLRIGIHLGAGFRTGQLDPQGVPTGTVIDFVPGVPTQVWSNMANFLFDIQQAGFEEVMIATFWVPGTQPNSPDHWGSNYHAQNAVLPKYTNAQIADRWWAMIQQLRAVAVNSGVSYKLDLAQELAPPLSVHANPAGSYNAWNEFASTLWGRYVSAYGSSDTVGFSFPTGFDSRIQNIPNVYGSVRPPVLSFHLYEDVGALLSYSDSKLDQIGMANTPIIIGETFYNNASSADAIVATASAGGRLLDYVTQWPLTPARSPLDCDQVELVPLAFSAYIERGL